MKNMKYSTSTRILSAHQTDNLLLLFKKYVNSHLHYLQNIQSNSLKFNEHVSKTEGVYRASENVSLMRFQNLGLCRSKNLHLYMTVVDAK